MHLVAPCKLRAYPWTSQEQEWQKQPRQSKWHSVSGLCWSCGASGARFWWGQTCDLHDTSRVKSRRSDQSVSVGPEISCTCPDTVARQPYVPAYWQQATVTGHRVRCKLHHQHKALLHWSDLHSIKRLKLRSWCGLKGYISKSTLARAMSTTTSNTRDTSNSSSCTPRLCTGLVTWNKYTPTSNWEPISGKKKKDIMCHFTSYKL